MKVFLKWVLVFVGVLVILFVAAAVLLPKMYDTEDLKQAISQEVTEQTGRELRIDGPLEFSVFPVLAVEVNELSLANAAGFGEQPLAEVGQARVGVGLLPLLRRELRADEVLLTGLRVNLMVNEQGASNWGDLAAGGTSAPKPESGGDSPFSSQRIAGLNISDARVEYQDAQAGSHYRLSDFSLETGALGDPGPVPVELALVLEDVAQAARVEMDFTGDVTLAADGDSIVLADANMTVAGNPTGMQPLVMSAPSLVANLSGDTLEMDRFDVSLGELILQGSLDARQISTAPRFSGVVEAQTFSPRRLMQTLGMAAIETSDPAAMESLSFSGTFSGDTDSLSLPDLELRLDDSHITGAAGLSGLSAAVPAVNFDFNIDQIDLDRYMAPATAESGGAEGDDVAIPSEELSGLDVSGQLKIESLTAMGMALEQAELGLRIQDSVLRLHPLTAGIYGGRYQGDITLDSSGAVPKLSLNEKVQSVLFQQLAADLLGYEQISGAARGTFAVAGTGATSSELVGSLEGTLGLQLDEGALEGIDIWYQIRKSLAMLKGQADPGGDTGRTVFTRLNLEAAIREGVLNLDELLGELPFLRLQGDGTVDLGQMLLDVGLVASIRSSPELSRDPLVSELAGKQVPFRISGSVAEPEISVDWANLLKSEATDRLMDKLGLSAGDGEAADSGEGDGDDLEQTARGLLGGLLGGKKKKDKEDEDDDGGS